MYSPYDSSGMNKLFIFGWNWIFTREQSRQGRVSTSATRSDSTRTTFGRTRTRCSMTQNRKPTHLQEACEHGLDKNNQPLTRCGPDVQEDLGQESNEAEPATIGAERRSEELLSIAVVTLRVGNVTRFYARRQVCVVTCACQLRLHIKWGSCRLFWTEVADKKQLSVSIKTMHFPLKKGAVLKNLYEWGIFLYQACTKFWRGQNL